MRNQPNIEWKFILSTAHGIAVLVAKYLFFFLFSWLEARSTYVIKFVVCFNINYAHAWIKDHLVAYSASICSSRLLHSVVKMQHQLAQITTLLKQAAEGLGVGQVGVCWTTYCSAKALLHRRYTDTRHKETVNPCCESLLWIVFETRFHTEALKWLLLVYIKVLTKCLRLSFIFLTQSSLQFGVSKCKLGLSC